MPVKRCATTGLRRTSPVEQSTRLQRSADSVNATGRTGGDALVGQLAIEGVRHVFGLPGLQLYHAIDAIARSGTGPAFVTTRHEQAASHMADGYARSTGDVGVCMVVPGPGLLNAATGLATAYSCSSPVLCIVGQLPSPMIGRGLGILHELPDQSATLRSLTKWSGIASSAGEVPGLVHHAMRALQTGRPRPVAIELPPDVLAGECRVNLIQPEMLGGTAAVPVEPDTQLLDKAAELLRAAHRPVLYAGGGVLAGNASGPLRALAETLEAPVVMSMNGRGALSDRHRLALNSVAGMEVLADADVVLAIGSRFIDPSGSPVATSPHAAVLLLNADPADLGQPRRPDLPIHGDASLGLLGLLDRLDSGPRRPARTDLRAIRARAAARCARIEPQAGWVRALRSAIPDEGILVTELTQVAYLARVAFPVYHPRTYLGPGYQGALGYGFPTALGAKVANPGRPVVSITGDGGFGYALAELATARQHTIGLITVIFNDSAYGNVRRDQREDFQSRFVGVDLHNPDFVKLANAFGVGAARATTPKRLAAIVREALSVDEPFVIEVPVGEMPAPWELFGRSSAR
jgi:acetolactate synthase I/II/III large subunit